MDFFTIETVGAAALGGAVGYLANGILTRRAIAEALGNAVYWKGEHKKSAADLGRTCAERDELKLTNSELGNTLDLTRDALDKSEAAIESMRPLYDLGRRRQAAIDRQSAHDKSARLGDEAGIVQMLLDEKSEVTTTEVQQLIGSDSRRAGFILRSLGAERIIRRDGARTVRLWGRPAADNRVAV